MKRFKSYVRVNSKGHSLDWPLYITVNIAPYKIQYTHVCGHMCTISEHILKS